VHAVRRYDSTYSRGQKSLRTYTEFVRNIRQTEFYTVFKKIEQIRASVQAGGLLFLTFVLTIVNLTNVFYYKISGYVHCPQQVQLRLTLYISGGEDEHKIFARSL